MLNLKYAKILFFPLFPSTLALKTKGNGTYVFTLHIFKTLQLLQLPVEIYKMISSEEEIVTFSEKFSEMSNF